MYILSFIKIFDGGLHHLVELMWNDPYIQISCNARTRFLTVIFKKSITMWPIFTIITSTNNLSTLKKISQNFPFISKSMITLLLTFAMICFAATDRLVIGCT